MVVNYSLFQYQWLSRTYFDAGLADATNDQATTEAKSVGLSGGIFTGETMSIAFNVNDNLSFLTQKRKIHGS